jgi:hypothetical protein
MPLREMVFPLEETDPPLAYRQGRRSGAHTAWHPACLFNKSDKPARALFWVSPACKLEALLKTLHNMTDIPAAIKASEEHDVDFLPESTKPW